MLVTVRSDLRCHSGELHGAWHGGQWTWGFGSEWDYMMAQGTVDLGDSGPGGSAQSVNYMMARGTVDLGVRLRVGLHDGMGDSGPGGSAQSGTT